MEAVLTSTNNLCFEQKYEKHQSFLSENFQVLEVKFSIYLNRHVSVMWANPADRKLVMFLLFFHWRQFTENVKSCFLVKIRGENAKYHLLKILPRVLSVQKKKKKWKLFES